jgi:hypothetical protein
MAIKFNATNDNKKVTKHILPIGESVGVTDKPSNVKLNKTNKSNIIDLSIKIPLVVNNTKLLVNPAYKHLINDIKTYDDIIKLDNEFSDAIIGFSPNLLNSFIDKNNKIINNIKVGNTVIRKTRYKKDNEQPTKVVSIHFAGLNNMTIIVAVLSDNTREPINRLELC